MKYFAFGSNMLESRICNRCKSAKYIAQAKLDNYSIVFNKISKDGSGKANITKNENDFVLGIVYEMTYEDIIKLDGFEKDYTRVELKLANTSDEQILVQTYISDRIDNNILPTKEYLQFIIDGAFEHRLPENYVLKLKSIKTRN